VEYLVSGDYQEASNCLRSLDAPHYHHELTKRALLLAFEKPEKAGQLMPLLAQLTNTGQISQVHLAPISLSTPRSLLMFFGSGPPQRRCMKKYFAVVTVPTFQTLNPIS
jgi:hypothetical protein